MTLNCKYIDKMIKWTFHNKTKIQDNIAIFEKVFVEDRALRHWLPIAIPL